MTLKIGRKAHRRLSLMALRPRNARTYLRARILLALKKSRDPREVTESLRRELAEAEAWLSRLQGTEADIVVEPAKGRILGVRLIIQVKRPEGAEQSAKITRIPPDLPAPSEKASRRSEIIARAPSRERVKALMERLPIADEWLEDEQDWTPPGTPGV